MTSRIVEDTNPLVAVTPDLSGEVQVQVPPVYQTEAVQQEVTTISTAIQNDLLAAQQTTSEQKVLSKEARQALDEYLEKVRDYQRYFSFELMPDKSVRVMVDTSIKPGTGRGNRKIRKTGAPTGEKRSIIFDNSPEDIAYSGMQFVGHQKAILDAYLVTENGFDVFPLVRGIKITDLSSEELASMHSMFQYEKILATGIGFRSIMYFLDLAEELFYKKPVQLLKEIAAKISNPEIINGLAMFIFREMINQVGEDKLTEVINYLENAYGQDFVDEATDYALRCNMHSTHNHVQLRAIIPLLKRAADVHKKHTIPFLATSRMDDIKKCAAHSRQYGEPLPEDEAAQVENLKQLLVDIGVDDADIQRVMEPFRS